MENLEKKLDIASKKFVANYGFMLGGTNSNLDEIKNIDEKSSWIEVVSWFINWQYAYK